MRKKEHLLSFILFQAFLIAFTSDFLPRLLYQYKFDNDLNGYVNFTLAYAPLNYTEYPMCRYAALIFLFMILFIPSSYVSNSTSRIWLFWCC